MPAEPSDENLEADLEEARLKFQRLMQQKWNRSGREPIEPAPPLKPALLGSVRVFPTREQMLSGLPTGGRIMEIGTWAGTFAAEMLRTIKPLELHIVDLDLSRFDRSKFGNRIGRDVFLHEGDSKNVLPKFDNEYFDFVYIDGDHSYAGVRHDLLQALRLVKELGHIGLNDYATWCATLVMPLGVMKAANEILNEHELFVRMIGLHHNGNHDIVIEKRKRMDIARDLTGNAALSATQPLSTPDRTAGEDPVEHSAPTPEEVASVRTFAEGAELFKQRFAAAVSSLDLAGLSRGSMNALVGEDTPDFARPYAFAYAARSLLHDPAHWYQEGPNRWHPTDGLRTELDALLSLEQAVNDRNNYYYDIILGIRDYIFGSYNDAFRSFASAARHGDFYKIVSDDFGGASFAKAFPTPSRIRDGAGNVLPRTVDGAETVGDRHAENNLVVSACTDQVYLRAFAPKWIRRIGQEGIPGLSFHLHCIFGHGHRENVVAELLDLARQEGLQLYITSEVISPTIDRAYFASARFLRGASILQMLRCPVLFVDADAYLSDASKLGELVTSARQLSDVHGLLSPGPWNGYLPWRRFSATWLFVPYSEFGHTFLQAVGDAIEYFWDERKGRNWWIDQMALEVARIHLTRAGTNDNGFVQIGRSFPNIMIGSEKYKIDTISELPEMQDLLKQGRDFKDALLLVQSQ